MVVISENDGNSDTKSTLFRGTSTSGSTSHSAPPPVYSPESFPSYQQIPLQHVPLMTPSDLERGRRAARKRFFRAFVIAVLFCVVFGSFFSGTIVIKSSYVTSRMRKSDIMVNIPHGPPAGPIKEDGNIISCYPDIDLYHSNQQIFDASEPPHSKSVQFSIPSSSSLVYFFSRGDYGFGSLNFELSDKDSDEIEVDVTIKYQREEMLEHSRVCSLERGDGERGIGFFTPFREREEPRGKGNRVAFNNTIRFPRSRVASDPLVINALETNMGIWSHTLEDLKGLVSFKSISLKGAVSPIRVSGVSAINGAFETSVGAISGSFSASESLILKTSVGAVSANVFLKNEDGNKATKLNVTTSVGSVNTNISLISTSKYPENSSFSVIAHTSAAPLNIAFVEAPTHPFSKLTLSAQTSLGPTNVNLHATYEGTIIQRTSLLNSPRLIQNSATEDPSGEHRHRSVSRNAVRFTSEAQVWWGEDTEKENYGSVEIATTMSPNIVLLS